MPITALPAAPNRATDTPTAFATKADAMLTALVQFVADANALQSDCNTQQSTATAQAAAAVISAANAIGAATQAVNALAAAQAALGASKWAAGAYGAGVAVWSPANGLLYRSRTALASSTTDPANDPTNWFPLSLQSPPVGYVTDTAGSMYGTANGGLNTINVITYSGGACLKYLPQNPNNGDFCTVLVANGRLDNAIYINITNPVPIVFGATVVTDFVTLDKISDAITFKYFATLNQWRKV